ncbi:MAG: hypothetical protein KJ625_08030 [Actinobacteria bacterium]|nr:hypothetical protein [Actinomycetota bacterium]MCG2701633.1 hypothetical protein [Candidatus Parcubacteria bacterium]
MSWPWAIVTIITAVIAILEAAVLIRGWLEKREIKIEVKVDLPVWRPSDLCFIGRNIGKKTITLEQTGYYVTGMRARASQYESEPKHSEEQTYLDEYSSEKGKLPYVLRPNEEFTIIIDPKSLAKEFKGRGFAVETRLRAFFEDSHANRYMCKKEFVFNVQQILL